MTPERLEEIEAIYSDRRRYLFSPTVHELAAALREAWGQRDSWKEMCNRMRTTGVGQDAAYARAIEDAAKVAEERRWATSERPAKRIAAAIREIGGFVA